MRKWFIGISVFCMLFISSSVRAAHPLITDDTGTQGKGKFLLELNGQYDWDREDIEGSAFKSEGIRSAATLSFGILDNADLIAGLPCQWGQVKQNDVKIYDEQGIGDAALEVKWRLVEKNKFSLALKPGITIPTGNNEKGPGAGRLGGHLFLIVSQELGSWAFHGNLGYLRNENTHEERRNIWHASFATTWEAVKALKLIVNIGIERNPTDTAGNDPAFLIGGIIYSITDKFDVDFGMKCGLSRSETAFSVMSGMALRF